jgi:hypothetical protein
VCCYTGTKFASPSVITIIMLIVVKFSVDMLMFFRFSVVMLSVVKHNYAIHVLLF